MKKHISSNIISSFSNSSSRNYLCCFYLYKKSNVENTMQTGKIEIGYIERQNGITLENVYPVEDSVDKVLSD